MRSKFAVLMALPLVLGLTQCDALKPKPKAPSPYSFVIRLELTPEAEAKLKATGSGIGITAFYYGQAAPAYAAEADNAHRIRLGYESATYGGDARKIRLAADDIDVALFPKIVDQAPLVLLTAQSTAPQGNPDMMLDCRSVVIPIKDAQATLPVIKCGLAGGV